MRRITCSLATIGSTAATSLGLRPSFASSLEAAFVIAAAATSSPKSTRAVDADHLDTRARSQAQLAFSDHRLARLNALIDHQILVQAQPCLYRTHLHTGRRSAGAHAESGVVFDDVHIGAVLPGLHRLIGKQQRVLLRRHSQLHVRIFAGPQPAARVLERALEPDRY